MSISNNKLYNDGLIINDENFDEILDAYVPENYLYEMGIGHEILFQIQKITIIISSTCSDKEFYA